MKFKLTSALAIVALLLPLFAVAQAPPSSLVTSKAFVGNASTPGLRIANLNVGTYYLTWIKSGTVSGCTLTIQVDTTAAFGSPVTVGAAQTCTSTGVYKVVGADITKSFARITVSSWTGTGTVKAVLSAYPNTPTAASEPLASDCVASATCAAPVVLNGAGLKVVTGSVALASATPSAVTVTGLSPAFTSSTSYHCAVIPEGNTAAIAAAGVAIAYVSGTSFTLTGPNTVTTVMDYVCVGK